MKKGIDLVFIAALCGLIGAIIFSLFWLTAVYVDGHWILGKETLSELGGDRPGRLFFNSGVIIEGILSLVFSSGVYRLMKGHKAGRVGTTIMFLGAISLIGVGVFPIDTGTPHTIFSYTFFGLMLLALSILIRPLYRHPVFGKAGSFITLSAVTISLAFLFTSPVPLTEAVAVICLLIWSSTISLQIIVNRRRMGEIYSLR